MTGIQYARWAVPISRIPHRTISALCVTVLCVLPPALHAQSWPAYGSGAYPNYPMPAPTPAYPPQQPIQRTQNIYYGNYQNNTVPGYIYPRNNQAPIYNNNSNGNGITYIYAQNPGGSNYYPYGPAYGTPGSFSKPPMPNADQTWPIPARTPTAIPAAPFIEDPNDEGRKPVVSFHRPTSDTGWVKADYLASFIRPMRFGSGPLATSGSPADNFPGTIGQPGTTVIFGKDPVDFNLFSGVRIQAGMFVDKESRFSVDFSGFLAFPNVESVSRISDGNGSPTVARPIVNVTAANPQFAFLTSLPGSIKGDLFIDTKSEMGGIEFNARYHSYLRERFHLEALFGFRYLRLAESLRIQDQITPLRNDFLTFQGGFVNNPGSLADEDSFRTVNQFFGPQIGGRVAYEFKYVTVDAFAKLGVGATVEQTNIFGSTTMVSPGGVQTASGGILALPSNMGNHSRTVIGIIPEVGFNLGIDLSQRLRLNLGYSFLLWNHVARPGGQYDVNVNPNQVPGSPTFGALAGPAAPAYRFNDELFWTHTFNFGLEFHY
jgi:hypothetical protein